MTTVVLQGKALTLTSAQAINEQLDGTLTSGAEFSTIISAKPLLTEQLQSLRQYHGFDINVVPEQFDPQQAALLVTDMDSTLISIECVDEIADFINAKADANIASRARTKGAE